MSFLDYSDEESDDELLTTPAALIEPEERINGCLTAVTPSKSESDISSPGAGRKLSPEPPEPHSHVQKVRKPELKNKFTLDGLLADHEEKADQVKEMDHINRELQEGLRRGGFVAILNKNDTSDSDFQIAETHRNLLQHFEVQESNIQDVRPGELVFQSQKYAQLFGSSLHPTHCGFTKGIDGLSLEKHIQSITPEQYQLLISSGIIAQCFTKISCQSQLLRWLFCTMSIHGDNKVKQGCKNMLLEILHYQHLYRAQKWIPRLSDIISIFVNFGATLETLVSCSPSKLELIRSELLQQPGYNQPQNDAAAGYRTENLLLVLQILTQALQGQRGRYSCTELTMLCVVLCKASLDTALKHACADGRFQNCIAMAVKQYTDDDWFTERLKLIRQLVGVGNHHHDRAYLAQLLPPGVRGSYLQRRYCYLVLNELLLNSKDVSDNELDNFEIQDLQPCIGYMRSLLEHDSYKLSSVITLLDLSVGVNLALNSAQREQLKSLLEQVRRVRVKDNVSYLDRTRVKDKIVRMTSKWALDIQTMKGKQTKIFEYASPVKMHIETIHTVQAEVDDSDGELPAKIQKISSATT